VSLQKWRHHIFFLPVMILHIWPARSCILMAGKWWMV